MNIFDNLYPVLIPYNYCDAFPKNVTVLKPLEIYNPNMEELDVCRCRSGDLNKLI